MIDRYLLPAIKLALTPAGRALTARGIAADSVTLTGFGIGLLAVPALAAGLWWLALALILANRLADGLDGVMARLQGPTDRGAFLDIALDFAFYGLVPLGFALADPAANALAAAVLLAAFMGTASSFLAFAVIAERHGTLPGGIPDKGLYYLGGLTEGAETITLFVLMCLFPGAFAPLALIFAAACTVTTVTRWRMGWAGFAGLPAAMDRGAGQG